MSADLANQVERIVLGRIEGDRLKLPAMPDIAARALGMLRDPNLPIAKVVTLVERDAMLTARVLRSASGAAFGGSVANLRVAITRLGMQRLRSVLTEHAAEKMFTSRDPRIATLSSTIWRHSLAVAMVARDLVTLAGAAEQAEVAYVGGLLHDVGKAVAAAMLLEAERHLGKGGWVGADEWLEVLRKIHRPIGVALATKWELPAEVIAVIRDCTEYDSVERTAPANFVRFANAVAKLEGLYESPIDRDDVEALVMIGRSLLSLDDALTERITQGLVARIDGAAHG